MIVSAQGREIGRLHAGVFAAFEALECGDMQLAGDILLGLMEGGAKGLPRLLCPECGLDCQVFGRLEVHRLNVHQVELEELEELPRAA